MRSGCIVVVNLRGIRESGSIFAVPTYLFIFTFAAMIVTGFVRYASGAQARAAVGPIAPGAGALTLFLVLRAFSSGCSALTGMEAIANGVPAFKPPESKNAATTIAWMAGIIAVFFLGLTILAHLLHVQPAAHVTVISQVGKTAFGGTPPYYLLQAATMLILIMASNTSFADFPRLASIMARDGFLPRHMMFRGDRLAFSAGILVLGVLASVLLVLFRADTHRLIPLYAVGVFLSFTLSQSGMVVHWLRSQEAGRRRSMIINGVGAVGTGIVVVIAAGTKFTHGAWIVLLAIPILVAMCVQIGRHYRRVAANSKSARATSAKCSKRRRAAARRRSSCRLKTSTGPCSGPWTTRALFRRTSLPCTSPTICRRRRGCARSGKRRSLKYPSSSSNRRIERSWRRSSPTSTP